MPNFKNLGPSKADFHNLFGHELKYVTVGARQNSAVVGSTSFELEVGKRSYHMVLTNISCFSVRRMIAVF